MPNAKLVAAPGDAGSAQGVAAIIAAAGDVDILVNNVGIFEIKDAFEIPDEDWTRMFETNVLSGVRFTRHYGPRMRDKGFGRIVFISSESGVQIPTEMIHYGFSKSADLALMRGFAQALAASGVTVNAVLPGPTRTEGVEEMFKLHGAVARRLRGRARLHRQRRGPRRSSSGWRVRKKSPTPSRSCARARRAPSPAHRCVSTAAW